MKLFVFGLVMFLLALSGSAQQGTVTFANRSGAPIFNADYGTNSHATVALYGSTGTNVSEYPFSLMSQIGATVNTFAPGLFYGGTRYIGQAGDLVTLMVRAWTGGFATFDQALVAAQSDLSVAVGWSQPWVQPVGGGILPTQPITTAGRFQGLLFDRLGVPNVPEPSSVALACLGLALAACRFRPS